MIRGSMWVRANGLGTDAELSGSTKGPLEAGVMKVRPAQAADVILQLPEAAGHDGGVAGSTPKDG